MTDRQRMHDGIMNWIRLSDRKPTVYDADESGTVWVYGWSAGVGSVHFYQTDSPYYTHWKPKEKRPTPPAPKGKHSKMTDRYEEAHPAITHCDNCGCDWLDNGLNPVGCPYCKLSALSETVNVIGMPEFDGLLDHIYEHGTAAEGVIEKANAFARAVIARYACWEGIDDD